MPTFMTSEVQDAHEPFVPDDEFFRLNADIDARVRFWRNEDEKRVRNSPGSEYECFWLVVAWRDGTMSYTQFPFTGYEDHNIWYRRFKRKYQAWLLLLMTAPFFRKGMQ